MEKIAIIVAALMCASGAFAQTSPEERVSADSLVFVPLSVVDTTLCGRDVFGVLPPGVEVIQSDEIRDCVGRRIGQNHSLTVAGYRIRIFFDNGRNARNESQSVLYRFKTRYPDVAAYRTFVSPYFKVTVGDFRTRSEALSMLSSLSGQFPMAFIVKEKLRFPLMPGEKAFAVDTMKVRTSILQD